MSAYWKKNTDSSVVYFDTSHFNIPNRRVGIGTDAPSALLDVNGTINAKAFTLNGSPFTGGGGGSTTVATSQRGYYNFVVNSAEKFATYAGQNILTSFNYSCTDRYYDYPNQTFSNHPAYPNYKNTLNYNAGDRILFKMKTIGSSDTVTDPVSGALSYGRFRIYRIPINNASGTTAWPPYMYYYQNDPNYPNIPGGIRVLNEDHYFFKLYEWNFDIGYLSNTQLPDNFTVGNYNDNLVITLEAGYVYYFTRRIYIPDSMGLAPIRGAIYEHPITIKVNDPVFLDADSYIPISRPQAIIGAYDAAYVPLTPTLPTNLTREIQGGYHLHYTFITVPITHYPTFSIKKKNFSLCAYFSDSSYITHSRFFPALFYQHHFLERPRLPRPCLSLRWRGGTPTGR
jgi:hypothetical protein